MKLEQLIDWGVATLTLAGQDESGDLHLVKPFPNGVLAAVVDGLGHGDEAAAAARLALATLESCAHESVIALLTRCHQAVRNTRGVVMSLASFNAHASTITWLGVGNVEGVLLGAERNVNPGRESILPRGGVVAYQLPPLHASTLPVTRGDTLLLATDGIRSGFAQGMNLSEPPQQIADQILARHGKGTDDALVLVARYLGCAA